jgi:hypothetical protein
MPRKSAEWGAPIKKEPEKAVALPAIDDHFAGNTPRAPSRRQFLGRVSGIATAAASVGAIGLQSLLGGKESVANASVVPDNPGSREEASFAYRTDAATSERVSVGQPPDNGDINRFTDFSGSYSKALKHDALGIPNSASWLSLKHALTTGEFSDFERILVGTPGGGPNSKLNGPQGALAFDLEGLDSHATVIPPAPSVASAQTAAEAVEHYWAALLRDVPFSQYPTSPLAAEAAADMASLSFISSNANVEYPTPLTPSNLFRGQIAIEDGSLQGPYVSQLLVQPTFFGAQYLRQQYQVLLPAGGGGADYMTSLSEYQSVQNGGSSGRTLAFDPTFRFIRNGRDLAAYCHSDVLYQAYLIAFLVLSGINTPLNPGNPYIGSRTEKPFGTLGGADAAATIGEMATRALKGAWFHKWIVNLRLRPEEYAALVHANRTRTTPFPQAAGALHSDVLSSTVLPLIQSTYDSYLLPQAYPEGSPTHPCYPTGHGAVAGACIAVLKFFFDCTQKIRPLLVAAGRDVYVPNWDGLSLNRYAGADRDGLDLNGELNKLAFNISFGHGIHAGIHFRSSTVWSILLGEQIALSILSDRAKSYSEPFSITITKFDGTTVTISNPGHQRHNRYKTSDG